MFEFLTLDLVLRLFGEHIGHGVVPAIALGLVVESLEWFLCDFFELI